MSVLELIRKHQLRAPVNVEGLIRELGLYLDKKGELQPDISGQIEPSPNGSYKITVNKSDHHYRQRFTMAHELGHYLFHRDAIGAGIDDDRMYRSTASGNFYNTIISREQETQANQFAANLLMPAPLVLKAWEERGRDLKAVANLFQVSPAALRIRLEGLLGEPLAA